MPSVSTSQPARRRTSSRAAAMHVNCAMVAPVTNPTSLPGGRPSTSSEPLARELLGGHDARA